MKASSIISGSLALPIVLMSACDSIVGLIPDQNFKPTAAFVIVETDNTAAGRWVVRFDASGSSDDSRIQSFIWDFGDGTSKQTFPPEEGRIQQHTYFVDSGTFVTTLVVEDDDRVFSEPFSLRFVLQENQPPTARFTLSPETGEAPLIVTLDASDSSDPDADDVNALWYRWDFGDGATADPSRSPVTQHIYTARRRYTIGLIVSDGKADSTPAFRFLIVE